MHNAGPEKRSDGRKLAIKARVDHTDAAPYRPGNGVASWHITIWHDAPITRPLLLATTGPVFGGGSLVRAHQCFFYLRRLVKIRRTWLSCQLDMMLRPPCRRRRCGKTSSIVTQIVYSGGGRLFDTEIAVPQAPLVLTLNIGLNSRRASCE